MLLFSVLFFKILLKVENKYAAKETLLEYEEQSAEGSLFLLSSLCCIVGFYSQFLLSFNGPFSFIKVCPSVYINYIDTILQAGNK